MHRAQISMEYLIIVGFTLFMLIPILLIYGSERQSIFENINQKQAKNVQTKIVDAAETVYYLGKPAKTTLKVYMPRNIQNITINPYSIAFIMPFNNMMDEVVTETTSVNLSGILEPRSDIQYIEIEADDYGVNISYKEV